MLSEIVQQQQIAQRIFDENVFNATNQIMSQYDNLQHVVTQPYLEIIN